jgi:phosphohistidine phosphatase
LSGHMKRLILMRHGKSSWDDPDLPDFHRPLNKRGKRDATVMARRLHDLQERPDLILASSAERAISTARIVADEIGFPKKKIVRRKVLYLASSGKLLDVLQTINNSINRVFLFGHNPGLTSLGNHLANLNIDNIPTCGFVCLNLAVESWADLSQGCGSLIYFEFPKRH